ncbi:sigma-54-dependent transcriptional regulator [Maridesulfovibrio salexigens]|uniref:Two component, sigma54 specific, transcriptional regulator, Fis family n=1 Tax=Maridesulfovibrio salexigens (strain ATCC 14822 / DSM 2638 / NCIMB 8403 / VKM B-1763) TaxID=526222 RepID=C6BYF2_MARSD|nr:sigma-54 dependent transcriptional regulator [Maridesulfovibrio salexigens]ACS78743.1 two component, sigma54 specific, transcriptional regulator, Fis family [Maridesulfovibrio salexigens DSM 2638]
MNAIGKNVLIVDDEPSLRLLIRAVLESDGWNVHEAQSGEQALEMLPGLTLNAALIDMRMEGMDGMALLKELNTIMPGLPVIMLTAYGNVNSAVIAMKHGAFDYLTKPADNEELKAVLAKALDYSRLVDENEKLKSAAGATEQMIGSSQGMLNVKDLIEQAGPSEATILVLGESGTGKELVAEGLHRASQRADKPLVKVNCAALPADLLESELFGYMKGAFTGANANKPGRFQLASGGTLFLDEIGEMDPVLQAKILRALQEKVVEPLGSVSPVETDVRIIAATNRDLKKEVEKGNFREDLYYRLSVLEIRIPPLRERVGDLPSLVAYLLEKLGRKNNKKVRSVSPSFLDALGRYDWPGNVRELENVLERAIILSRSEVLGPELLPPQVINPAPRQASPEAAPSTQPTQQTQQAAPTATGTPTLDDAERQALIAALEANQHHRERTAEALGISRRTLQYKLKKYGLTRR